MARILAQVGLVADGPVAAREERRPFWLWPCNAPTWVLWLRLQTQWRTAGTGMGGSRATGLDYAAVWATLTGLRVRKPHEVFEHLQQMERAALRAWGEQAARQQRGR